MGIRNIHAFLHKACPHLYREVSLEEYAGVRVAVDFSIYLCKFKTSYGPRWLDALFNFILLLRRNRIDPVFVFDTKSPPEKAKEKAMRSNQRKKNMERILLLEDSLEKYNTTGEVINPALFLPLLERFHHDVRGVESEISKMRSNILFITPEDFVLGKTLLTLTGIPFVHGEGEAEGYCSFLCRHGLVGASMTEDTDVLAYQSPVFLHKINIERNTVIRLVYREILDHLQMTPTQFTEFCIMCGCDYNHNLPKIGPEKSFRLLKQYGNIDQIGQHTGLDVTCLNHNRITEIFMNLHEREIDEIPGCRPPDVPALNAFLFHHNSKIGFPYALSILYTGLGVGDAAEKDEQNDSPLHDKQSSRDETEEGAVAYSGDDSDSSSSGDEEYNDGEESVALGV